MAAKKERSGIDPHKLELYDKLIDNNPAIERKGATIPYTSLNGHMFSLMDNEGTLAIRLPEKERAEFLKKYNTSLRVAYGIVQKEYAVVPASLFEKTNELRPYFESSFNYVKSLKPKTGKKS